MRIGVVCPQRHQHPEVGESRIEVAAFEADLAALSVSRGEPRIALDRPFEIGQGERFLTHCLIERSRGGSNASARLGDVLIAWLYSRRAAAYFFWA